MQWAHYNASEAPQKNTMGQTKPLGASAANAIGPSLGYRQHRLKNDWAPGTPLVTAATNAMGPI